MQDGNEGRRRGRLALPAMSAWLGAVVMLSGCAEQEGGPSEGTGGAPREAAQNVEGETGFDTAGAVVKRYNELTMAEPLRFAEAVELFRAEGEVQEKLLRIMEESVAIYEMGLEVRARWADEFERMFQQGALLRTVEAAKIIEQREDEATAKLLDEAGREQMLHLMEADDRWWVSARTLQEMPDIARELDRLDAAGLSVRINAAVARHVTKRLRNGDFETMREFMVGYDQAMEAYAMQHPEEMEELQRLMAAAAVAEGGGAAGEDESAGQEDAAAATVGEAEEAPE